VCVCVCVCVCVQWVEFEDGLDDKVDGGGDVCVRVCVCTVD
jgi:hypothetical protein